MQTDRLAYARAFRRREADMRMAEDMRLRGWTCVPPQDDVQIKIEKKIREQS
jgi:hypothetical protein